MKKGLKMNDNRIGNGTMIVTCYNCGESLLSGEMTEHLRSKECQETGKKNRMKKDVKDLRKRVTELEERD